MHEAGVRAIFEQAADEIGEQVAVGADGGIDAHRARRREQRDERVMRALAHAVQPLQLIIGAREQFGDKRQRHRIVAGEGRIDAILTIAQQLGAAHIIEVGVEFRGEHRKIAKPSVCARLISVSQ